MRPRRIALTCLPESQPAPHRTGRKDPNKWVLLRPHRFVTCWSIVVHKTFSTSFISFRVHPSFPCIFEPSLLDASGSQKALLKRLLLLFSCSSACCEGTSHNPGMSKKVLSCSPCNTTTFIRGFRYQTLFASRSFPKPEHARLCCDLCLNVLACLYHLKWRNCLFY